MSQNIKMNEFIGDYGNHPPKFVNYDILGLAKKKTFSYGDLIEVIYYQNYDAASFTYSNPVVKESRIYTYQNGILISRTMTIIWYWDDGTECNDTRTIIKYYDSVDAMQAVVEKRKNIIADVKQSLIGWLLATGSANSIPSAINLGKAYLAIINLDLATYVEGAQQPLIDNITNDISHTWLNNIVPSAVSIRELLIAKLNYPIA